MRVLVASFSKTNLDLSGTGVKGVIQKFVETSVDVVATNPVLFD
jgi:hypothetical protein